ncbi:hypothetical protein V3C99_013559 [Haemonchus contortus]
MDSSTPSLSRRLSYESTTTSEFEVISRDRSSSPDSNKEGSFGQEISISSSPLPGASIEIPDLYSGEHYAPEQSLQPSDDDPAAKSTLLDRSTGAPSFTNTASQISTSDVSIMAGESASVLGQAVPDGDDGDRSTKCSASQASESDISRKARESAGMLEQVFHELYTLKRRNSMLEKMAQQSSEWRIATEQLEEETKMLKKTVKACRTREQKLSEEMDELRQERDYLLAKTNPPKVDLPEKQSRSFLQIIVVFGILIAAVAIFLGCYVQLLKERRHCKDLEEQLVIMNDLIEKLEVEHAAEYQRRLDETSKRITDDMRADIAAARKERELEHERLLEAYREKMLLYDDLTTLRKEKSQKGKKYSSWR